MLSLRLRCCRCVQTAPSIQFRHRHRSLDRQRPPLTYHHLRCRRRHNRHCPCQPCYQMLEPPSQPPFQPPPHRLFQLVPSQPPFQPPPSQPPPSHGHRVICPMPGEKAKKKPFQLEWAAPVVLQGGGVQYSTASVSACICVEYVYSSLMCYTQHIFIQLRYSQSRPAPRRSVTVRVSQSPVPRLR